ncbi:aminophospholipid translocase [Blastocladiella emersonii ATCC 22665]|nr:aminophospholipid translocase [Blastocladiella emersonii ATCC 22665]
MLGTLRRGNSKANLGSRFIHINDEKKNDASKFIHNGISTAKYNVITFLPKFLFEQFSKYANVFFLFTAIIQQIDDISPTSKLTTIIPLTAVLLATAGKEMMEDFKRHAADNQVNARQVKVLAGSRFVEKRWDQVKVGDVLRVDNSEFFAADLILLASSEPDAICYIETSNLDGETNLKIKQGRKETADLTTPDAVARLGGVVESEQPNNSLYTFDGTMRLSTGATVPLDPSQILLRGAQLRNTPWIYGLVVFTGHESKLMRNASAAPIKRTNVERMTNVQIVFLFVILLTLALACSIGTWALEAGAMPWFIPPSNRAAVVEFIRNILTFIILFNNLIPISLIVTMEVVKYQQAQLINADLDMYYEPTDTPALCRTSSLVEELGQIEYIFSDKTGTLTCNVMEFRQCIIAGKCYSNQLPEGKRSGDPMSDGSTLPLYDFNTLAQDFSTEFGAYVHEFFLFLAACHTVIPEVDPDDIKGEIKYQAASPDEGALVGGAREVGYVFHMRRPTTITVNVRGRDMEIEVLNICEFNSTRKRMSAVLRFPDGTIKLYCKGADTVIFERLDHRAGANAYVDITTQALEEYASEGLRTLCMAHRTIPEQEYREWAEIYDRAATTLVNRADELDKAAELIEKNLVLLGATAIEDKLQDGVPETIATLAMAGIKIWVLTGDRQETAINIGYSCKLLTEDMNLLTINYDTYPETKMELERQLKQVRDLRAGATAAGEQNESLALIIDGRTLDFALEKDLEKTFLELACNCKAVICCRVSPLQKALVVKLVKRHRNSLLLAIGDGANDVSMIQAAHVGVGISGMEGLQAARSADFAISQFRYLRKLLLVHGAWSYQRLSKLILYSFYKNICLYMTQFWFAIYNGFSGQTIYESWTISYYNVAFAVLPPLIIGIFDQFASARMLDRYPQMYMLGQRGEFFNVKIFWSWTFNAFWHSVLLYFVAMLIFNVDAIFATGFVGGHWALGCTLYTAVLATVILKAALITDLWTKWAWMATFGSIGLWMVFLPVYSLIAPRLRFSAELLGMEMLYTSPVFWFTIIVLPVLCLTRDFAWKYFKRMYATRSYHIVQEIQKFNIPDYRPRMERFRQAVHKVRMIQRLKRNRGFAFSQNESGQADLIRVYDTTRRKPRGPVSSPPSSSRFAVLLAALLVLVALVGSVAADCCTAIGVVSDAATPQQFTVQVMGKGSGFYALNKRYEVQIVFPSTFSIQPPIAMYTLSQANCTRAVNSANNNNNNNNAFMCSYASDNPAHPTDFGVEFKVIVPPAAPGQPAAQPAPTSVVVNTEKCPVVNALASCPAAADPVAPSDRDSGSGSGLKIDSMINLSFLGTVPLWLVVIVGLLLAGMLIGFLGVCYRNYRGNPERRNGGSGSGPGSRGGPGGSGSPNSRFTPTLPTFVENDRRKEMDPADPSWWRRHAGNGGGDPSSRTGTGSRTLVGSIGNGNSNGNGGGSASGMLPSAASGSTKRLIEQKANGEWVMNHQGSPARPLAANELFDTRSDSTLDPVDQVTIPAHLLGTSGGKSLKSPPTVATRAPISLDDPSTGTYNSPRSTPNVSSSIPPSGASSFGAGGIYDGGNAIAMSNLGGGGGSRGGAHAGGEPEVLEIPSTRHRGTAGRSAAAAAPLAGSPASTLSLNKAYKKGAAGASLQRTPSNGSGHPSTHSSGGAALAAVHGAGMTMHVPLKHRPSVAGGHGAGNAAPLIQLDAQELEIPATVRRSRSYKREKGAGPSASAAAPVAPAAAPAAVGGNNRLAPAPSLRRTPSASRRAPETSAAAVAAAISRPGVVIGSDPLNPAYAGEYEDPNDLAAMGIKPNSPEKDDRIRNWAGVIATIKTDTMERPAGAAAAAAAAEADDEEEEDEPIGVTLTRGGSGLARKTTRAAAAAAAAAASDSDDEAPLAFTMPRGGAPAGGAGAAQGTSSRARPAMLRSDDESEEEDVPLAAVVNSMQRERQVDDVINSYMR